MIGHKINRQTDITIFCIFDNCTKGMWKLLKILILNEEVMEVLEAMIYH